MKQFDPSQKLKRLTYTVVYSALLCLLPAFAYSQSQTVSGKVLDEQDNPLPGVNVLIKGSGQGTITNVEGNFNLQANGDDVLIFSFVGYETKEVAVNNQSEINVQLSEDAAQLDEVVVVGYGTQKKVNLSGAVDQIDAEVIENRPISNISQGLQGIIPNLNVDFLSGEPGAAANINIRGLTSINGGNPLILIDGVPSDAVELNRISPQDIQNISVIKDASAAAIYGARAAFGVILITTKMGDQEGVSVSYSNNFSWDRPTIVPDKITDPYIYLRLAETATDNTPWDYNNYTDQTYLYAKQRSEDPSIAPVRQDLTNSEQWEYMGNRDWSNYFMSESSFSQNHSVSVDGMSEKARYFISGNYNRQNGIIKVADDYFDRYSFRSKVDYDVTDWFTLGNNTFLTNTTRKQPSAIVNSSLLSNTLQQGAGGSSFWEIYNLWPTDWHVNPDGSWGNNATGRLAARMSDGGSTSERYNSLQSRFTAQLSFWDDLLKVNADYTYRRGSTNFNYHTNKYNIGFGPDDVREEGQNFAHRSAGFEDYNVFNVYGTLNKEFGVHDFTAIVGYNQEYYRSEFFSAERNNVISSSLPTVALATGDANVNEVIGDWAIRGAFYRLNYILLDRYIVEFNGRYDGSSRFPEDKRFGFFPSASAAWRVDQEQFFDPLTNVVSTFKLRASYGSLGNQAVSDYNYYGYIPTMAAYQSDYLIGGNRPQEISSPGLVSPNYTWEQVNTVNFGVDLGFFGDRLTANFDIYERNTLGMLTLGRDLPDVLGASEPAENAADLRNNGWELALNYRNDFNVGGSPLSFNTKFVLSDSRATITSFDNPNRNLTQYYEGMDLGEIWGLESDGLFASEDEIQQLDQTAVVPWGALSIVPGWPRYIDQDGNGVIEKGTTVDDPKDLSVIGNISPRYRFGLDLNMSWKGFDLRTFFQGVAKRDYYPRDYLYWGFYQQPYAGGYAHLNDFYRATADSDVDRSRHSQSYIEAGLADQNLDAYYPVLQAWLADRNLGERIDQAQGLAIPQTRYLLNGSYLRLKNLTVGYTLPQAMLDRVGIERLRVFVSGENVFEWSELKDYYDPEAINDNNNYNPATGNSRQVGSGYAYPVQRRFAVGVNVNF
ncbi:TonB-linked SusC/RagA family outer membrane protein [Catalinimonas alkaloidigena]|uniref:SusC/RagA family TonB-linked outer membrane protein n=1 Tax=Catalinimonas alkaloidigena TaxID=1075417 RepID=UPI0024058BFF|nr:TonB-dependent receptor [Catalinimonas alkaloidigena]MDF9795619.1 TonB-linked SusC/RagA family outer membrane protein [Catalinimonas alkaloidigena]